MRKIILLTLAALSASTLAACSTPKTFMKHEQTGDVKYCGGDVSASLAAGFIGYGIQRLADGECVREMEKHGYKVTQ